MGSVDPANQIHDFNPGTPVDGLFWTAPIPVGSVAVSPGRGRATWMLEGFELPDFHDLVSALLHRPAVGTGVVDMTMTWTGGGQASQVSDTAVDFTGRRVTGSSHISFTIETGSGTLVADEQGQVSSVSEVWKERNGVFF